MIFAFVLMVITGFVFIVSPFDHNFFYTTMLAIGTVGAFIISFSDVHFGKRYHVTVGNNKDGEFLRITDRHFKMVHELELVETPDYGAEIVNDHNSLNRISFRAQTGSCDYNHLLMRLGSLVDVDRSTTSDNMLNLMLLVRHQKPVILNTCLADYAISDRARRLFARDLKIVV